MYSDFFQVFIVLVIGFLAYRFILGTAKEKEVQGKVLMEREIDL